MVNPNRFYTYAYLREDKTPYYIGKGSNNRIYKSRKGVNPPKDKKRIIFLKKYLTEEEAFKHEIYMIKIFGRKDLKTGILHNKTDGGDGSSGAIRSSEFRLNLSKINKNKTLSKEHREKIGNAQRGNKNHNYGKCYSQETKEKMSKAHLGEKHPKANWWKLTFSNGNVIEICGLSNWAKENNYSCGNIHMVYLGNRKKHKDIVKVIKIK